MNCSPVVYRELRLASRAARTYWSRAGAAAAAIVGVFWIMVLFNSRGLPAFGPGGALSGVEGILYIWCVFAGMGVVSDAIASEIREGTLGLLLLTPLRAWDVVMGKLSAGLVASGGLLLAALPALSISVLIGGITGSRVLKTILVLGNTLFLSLAAGLLVSALSKESRRWTSLIGVFGILSSTLLPTLIDALIREGLLQSWQGSVIRLLNPHYTLMLGRGQVGVGWQFSFALSFLLTHGLGWLMIWIASLAVVRASRDRPATPWRERIRSWWDVFQLGRPTIRQQRRRGHLEANPVSWLVVRRRFQNISLWLGFFVIVLFGGLLQIGIGAQLDDSIVLWGMVTLILALVIRLTAINDACAGWVESRESGALEMLIVTPLAVREIMAGHSLGLWRRFRWPLATVVVATFFLCLAMVFHAMKLDSFWKDSVPFRFAVTVFLGIAFLFADLLVLWRIGIWSALKANTKARATQIAVERVMLLPWLLTIFTLIILLFTDHPPSSYWHGVAIWAFWSIVADVWAWHMATINLDQEMRWLVTARYQPPRLNWWGRARRWLANLSPINWTTS